MDCKELEKLGRKFERGEISQKHLEFFNGLSRDQLDRLVIGDDRFELIKKFGLTIPDGYNPVACIKDFRAKLGEQFFYFDENVNDGNFQKTTRLMSGQKFEIWVFQLTEDIISRDCLVFLKKMKATLAGAQGICLAYELGKKFLPSGGWCISLDEAEALWIDPVFKFPGIPAISCDSKGEWRFELLDFNFKQRAGGYLLCFCAV